MMWSLYIELVLVLVAISATTGRHSHTKRPRNNYYHHAKPCSDDKALLECVTQYAKGFANPRYHSLDDLKLHCLLDNKLAKCANRYLSKYSGATFKSLAKATVLYVLFENKLKVCNLFKYKSLLKKLNKVDEPDDVKRYWRRKIKQLSHPGRIPKCAKEVDMGCVKEYAQRMRKDQNLCANIPFKSECLRSAYQGTCPAAIVGNILDIFPVEVDKVLAKLCIKAQDQISG